ncbi:hypothetical protein JCM19231_3415 [Vibrio ishigakensis]|uniref:Uncharacterized protein n=1 Tax=Vibrio ishigakensis TaxID=1481914 RepID=A0A0B8P627_9VIBR|nr:hypothetical protein JCM19231_3415 [Vibrio ishigakensis]
MKNTFKLSLAAILVSSAMTLTLASLSLTMKKATSLSAVTSSLTSTIKIVR